MSAPRLELRAVRKTYGPTVALARGDLALARGEIHVLMGANGSGKSTLCKIVAGTVRPDGGTVLHDGREVSVADPREARALGVGIFFQELSLAANRTVAENIALGDLPARGGLLDRRAVRARAEELVALFDGVGGEGFAADAVVGRLRADQKQLVEILKTLATEASLLIFDEPTSALDRAQAERFFAVLRRLRDEGRAIVFISHRMDEVFAVGDRVTVIRDGETVATLPLSETDRDAVVRLMVGEREDAAADAPTGSLGAVVLSVDALEGPQYHDVAFRVRAGEILGLGGLHGHGQSATLRALFGIDPPARGTVALHGRPLTLRNPRAAIRAGLAYVSGDRGHDGIVPGRSILENVVPVHALLARLGLARPARLRSAAEPAMNALSTKFGEWHDPIGSLSGGNQQKVVIARSLIEPPQVLLLDDPTKGIDLGAKAELFAEVRRLAAAGMAIVLYSSEDAELLAHADRIAVFNDGRIVRVLEEEDRNRFELTAAAYESAAYESAAPTGESRAA